MDFSGLYRKVIDHYFAFETTSYIVPNSIPILYFGSLEEYRTSKLKIVTVGLNPSDVEFKKDRFRLKDHLRVCTLAQFERSLSDYFKFRPYSQWFDQAFEKLLQSIGVSFYGGHYPGKAPSWWRAQPNVALHTDLGSPLATSPTWSKLPRDVTERLQRIGFPIWRELVELLEPNLILISVSERHLPLLGALSWRQLRIGVVSGTEPELRISKLGKSTIVWGRAQVRPFFFLRSEHLPLLAAAIFRELEISHE